MKRKNIITCRKFLPASSRMITVRSIVTLSRVIFIIRKQRIHLRKILSRVLSLRCEYIWSNSLHFISHRRTLNLKLSKPRSPNIFASPKTEKRCTTNPKYVHLSNIQIWSIDPKYFRSIYKTWERASNSFNYRERERVASLPSNDTQCLQTNIRISVSDPRLRDVGTVKQVLPRRNNGHSSFQGGSSSGADSPSHFLLPLASISSRSAGSSPCRRLHVSRPPPQPRTTLRETRSNAYLVRASGIVQPSSSPPTSPPLPSSALVDSSLGRFSAFDSNSSIDYFLRIIIIIIIYANDWDRSAVGPAITAILREGTMRRNCSRQEAERRRGWDDRLEAAAAATAAAAAAAGGGAADSTGVVVYRNWCRRWRRKHARGVCTHPG